MTAENDQLQMVRDFHSAFGYEQMEHGNPRIPHLLEKVVYARMSFIAEELAEILISLASNNREKQLDGGLDLSYFVLGTLAIMGKDVYNPHGGYVFIDDEVVAGPQIYIRTLVDAVNKVLFTMTFWHDTGAMKALPKQLSYLHYCCVNFVEKGVRADFVLAFEEVQRSNMSKLDTTGNPIYSEAGKIMKGPDFSEPVLHPFLHA